ncbi:exosortase-dependent surface protein XDP2 [Lusitaniella coriacea]|uniref:exosortase-dependent surface protein XDP2 n=1 Tax=Lusitaniella coriacea TaxID=1983105 RepID=UPI003CF4A74E
MRNSKSLSLKTAVVCASLIAGGAIAANSAQANPFRTNYTADLSGSNLVKGNIWLDSVVLENGETIDQFSVVQSAKIVSNDLYTGGNTGAASADMGDLATVGLSQERVNEAGVVAALGNLNLNSIIDTEDRGSFAIDLFFDKALDNLFVWERGQNSKLKVQALDATGSLIGNALTINSRDARQNGGQGINGWTDAGFSIDTLEIGRAQKVASLGISMADFGIDAPVSGVRFISERGFNGPDWKFVGASAERNNPPASVPEPGTLAGLAVVCGMFAASRRRKASQ